MAVLADQTPRAAPQVTVDSIDYAQSASPLEWLAERTGDVRWSYPRRWRPAPAPLPRKNRDLDPLDDDAWEYITPARAREIRLAIEQRELSGAATTVTGPVTMVTQPSLPPRQPPLLCTRGGRPSERDRAAVEEFAAELERRAAAAAAGPPPPPSKPCDLCGAVPAGLFLFGRRCVSCAPPQPVPDPELTAAAFRARRDARFRPRASGG